MIQERKEFSPALAEAFRKWAAPVISTMGGAGKNVMIYTDNGPRITQDGVTVARYLNPTDPVEKLAVRLLVDAANKVVQEVGDGTTLTVLLVSKLFQKLAALPSPKNGYFETFRKLDFAVEQVVDQVKLSATTLRMDDDMDRLKAVATIACHGNVKLGHMIAKLTAKVGPDGMIFVEQSPTSENFSEYSDGYVMNTGLVAPHFVNDSKGTCTLKDPLFVIVNEKVDSEDEVFLVLKYWKENYYDKGTVRPIVWIVEDMQGGALATVLGNLPGNSRSLAIPMAVVKAPDFGARRQAFLEDIKFITKTPFVYSKIHGRHLRDFGGNFEVAEFGEGTKFVANAKRSVIFKKFGVKQYTDEIKSILEEETDPAVRDLLKERVAKLSSGVGTIFVGGDSDAENQWNYDMADDAQRACMAALRSGIVPGGGKALLNAGKLVVDILKDSGTLTDEARLIAELCSEPMKNIYSNAGIDFDLEEEEFNDKVFDVSKGKRVDPMKVGLIDPVEVPVTALQKAVSVVKQAMNTDFIIIK